MITYTVEHWNRYYPECLPLWKEHYAEFEQAHKRRMKMAPDVETFENLDLRGQLQILVARDDGKMIGYCLVVIKPHIHYCNSICGFEDSYYLSKSYRKGMTGVKLLKKSIEHLRARGVEKVFFMTKEFISIAKILEYLGMEKTDEVYSLWLKE